MSLIKTDFAPKTKALSAEVNANFVNLLALQVCNEDFTPLTNGILVTFTTAFKFKPGTIRVFGTKTFVDSPSGDSVVVQGLRMRPTADFTENLDINGNGVSITMTVVPGAGTLLVVDYQKANV